jgi:hypothetical protein
VTLLANRRTTGQSGEGRKWFFFEKRRRPLIVWAEPIRKSRSRNTQKFFGYFFQKRRPCLSLLAFTRLPCAAPRPVLTDRGAARQGLARLTG